MERERSVIFGIRVSADLHDLLHEGLSGLSGNIVDNVVYNLDHIGALFERDGNAGLGVGCGEAGVVVDKRQIGQRIVLAADLQRGGLFGDVAVDGAGLECIQKICEIGVVLLYHTVDLVNGFEVEGAGLRANDGSAQIRQRFRGR